MADERVSFTSDQQAPQVPTAEELLRLQTLAQVLREQAENAPIDEGRMIGKYYLPPQPLNALARNVQNVAGIYYGRKAAEGEQARARDFQQAFAGVANEPDILAAMLRSPNEQVRAKAVEARIAQMLRPSQRGRAAMQPFFTRDPQTGQVSAYQLQDTPGAPPIPIPGTPALPLQYLDTGQSMLGIPKYQTDPAVQIEKSATPESVLSQQGQTMRQAKDIQADFDRQARGFESRAALQTQAQQAAKELKAMPATAAPISAAARLTVNSKLINLQNAKRQLAVIKEKAELLDDPKVRLNPLSREGQAFDSSIESIKKTIKAITRVQGEGTDTNMDQIVSEAQLPKRFGVYKQSSIDDKIKALEESIDTATRGYSSFLGGGNAVSSPGPSAPGVFAAPVQPTSQGESLEEKRRKLLEKYAD